MNPNSKVIGLTRLGIKPKSTALEADAHTTRPSELLNTFLYKYVAEKIMTRQWKVHINNCRGPKIQNSSY